jgi:signal transduction histidine kinase
LTSSHVVPDIVSPALQELLFAAADRAAAQLSGSDKDQEAEIREQFARIIRLCLAASDAEFDVRYDVDRAVAQRINPEYVATLRRALVQLTAVDGMGLAAVELATLLVSIDRVSARPDPVQVNEFTRHLANPHAINAVMEIAHDMRSPLTSILFLVETLRRGRSGPVTTVQERQLGLIYGAALGLNTLACDVIDAVKGGQRLVDGRPIPFSVAEVILGVCDTVCPISEEKSIPITHVLPSADGRIGYPGAVGRVLLNLMTNALKYTNEGSVTIGATELDETRLSFWVSDTGQGIPEHVMGMLFEGFRPSASGMRFSNAGLGLAICQDFLSAMGTSLKVESKEDLGTRFSFELDLRRA